MAPSQAGHVSLGQLKVMSAIENCRTAALGGHVARCENEKCGYTLIAYNSCRNALPALTSVDCKTLGKVRSASEPYSSRFDAPKIFRCR